MSLFGIKDERDLINTHSEHLQLKIMLDSII